MNYFNTPFGYSEGFLPIEKDRYRLIQAEVCPFAARPVIARSFLGLDQAISQGKVSSVKPDDNGWAFTLDENNQDPVLNVEYVKDIYLHSEPDYDGAYAVPVLVDETNGVIARKESADILRDLIIDFKPFHDESAPNLYPINKQEEIEGLNQSVTPILLKNVYKLLSTEDKDERQALIDEYFNFLDDLDKRLADNRYIHGDEITESDIMLYTPLVRLNIAYGPLFGMNKYKLSDYKNLWPYMRDLYQTPGFKENTNFKAIQDGYYATVGKSPIPDTIQDDLNWEEPHGRENM